jgi:Carbohydrate binding module (family 6)/F5/8 type C domain/Abnormal spindle-like microcephaly-assoc'd, ASPM-SPD-2-Hydin
MKPLPAPAIPRIARRRLRASFAMCAAVAALLSGAITAVTALTAPSAMAAASYQAPNTPDPSVAGATTPFTTYQAPEATLGGGASVVSLTSAPTSEYDSPQGEATGHAYVQLTGPGQSVQWTNNTGQPINFINVRASIPDSSSGGGMTATLDLYVNGTFRQALNMNSIQSWQYEGNNNYNGSDQNPADGDPRDFWDDFNAFVTGTPIPAGATFSLQKDSSNTAQFYWINSIDLWDAPAPAAQPANSISITSCGAVADNTPTNGAAAPGATDSTADIQNCVNQAASQGKILWIPQGTFYLMGTSSIVAQNVTVEGAGYLYSEIYRDVPLPNNTPLGAAFQCYSCQLENFHIDSDAMSRAEVDGGGGAEDTTGTNWLIEGMWVQHVESSLWASGSGGTVENNFFTDIWADGCNLNNVSLTGTSGSNLTATNNYIRGTGDDAMAINSVAYNGSQTYTAMSDITLTHNTLLAAWGGKGIGIYGGSGHLVENNYIADTARYIGLGVGRFGVNGSDMLGATVSGNWVVRAGGNAYFQGQPALQIGNGGDGQNVGTVNDATVDNNTIINSVYDSIGFSTSTNTDLASNTITSPWRNGIVISPPYYPAPTGNASITGNTVTGVGSGFSAYSNDSSGFTATLSNNSWQGGSAEGPYNGTPAGIPGTVYAANYDTGGQGVAYNVTSVNGTGNSYRSDGVDLEACSDTGCGYDLGWTATGQWFKYTVNVATAGTYTVSLRLASPSGVTDGLHIANTSGTNLSGNVNVPATGGWQTWATVTASVTLPAGQQTLTVDQDNGGWNMYYMAFASGSGGGPTSALTASPSSVSFGNQAVGSTSGAQTVTVSNPNAVAVSVSSVSASGPFAQTNTCGSSIAANGSCTVSVKFAPTASGSASGSLSVASSAPSSPLTVALSGTGTTSTAEGPYNGTPAGIPGTVYAANYDTGGQGVAYNVTSSNGTANSYRPDGIDLEATSDTSNNTGAGADDLGWTTGGQWFRYTVNVATAGTYTVSLRLASPSGATDGLHIANSAGTNLSGNVNVPATGGWQTWATVTASVTLPAGVQTLTVDQDNAGWNIHYLAFASGGNPDLALNAQVTASSYTQTYVPGNAVDGNTSTYWEATNATWPSTITVNLGSVQTLGSVTIDLPPSTAWSTRTQTLSVLGSTNGSTFTTLVGSATYTWNPSTGNTVTIQLPSGTSDQYVELSFTANSVQNGAQASEILIYA